MTNEASLDLDILHSAATIENPYPVYTQLRTTDPVHWNPFYRAWMLTRYDDVQRALQEPGLFSSDYMVNVNASDNTVVPADDMPFVLQIAPWWKYNLQGMDPPGHTRQRNLINKTFTPRTLEHIRGKVQQIVDGMLDGVQTSGSFDVIRDLAYPLPSTVILELLGIPLSDRQYIKASADAMTEFIIALTGPQPGQMARLASTFETVSAYLRGLIAQRRQEPQEDLLTKLALAEESGEMLSEEEIVITCNFLLFAGHETTANLIGSGLMHLLQNREQWELLVADPALLPGAIEELLRYVSPVGILVRVATADVEMGGKQIHAGDTVELILGAANRDPAKFTDPEKLDIRRENLRSLGFGYGIHFCVGAALARMESQIAFATLLRRFPQLKLAAETGLVWRPNHMLPGLTALPVSF